MKIVVQPASVNGIVAAPASKSYLQRALMAATLSKGQTNLYACSWCNDTRAVLEISQNFGAKIEFTDDHLTIDGNFSLPEKELNCHESGLALRMISPIAALLPGKVVINGSGSLLSRPIDLILDALINLSVGISSNNKRLPLTISGNMQGGDIEIDGSKGSQLLTGLLMALPVCSENSSILVHNLKSKPYIEMTIGLLHDFGIEIQHLDYKQFTIEGNQSYKAIDYTIEGDWSGAAFLLVAGAIAGKVCVTGLNQTSKQADRKIVEVLQAVGSEIDFLNNSISITKNQLRGFEFEADDCPDLFPPLVTLASQCDSPSKIHGVQRLFTKESNRAESLKTEFKKIGVNIEISGNTMIIFPSKLDFGKTDAHNDHRVAMALAVAALTSEDGVEIDNFDSINKSYPQFLDDLLHITKP